MASSQQTSVEHLRKLCSKGKLDDISSLIGELQPEIWLEKCADGNTPLHVTVAKGHIGIFKLISGAITTTKLNISKITGFAGRTLLHQACKGGCIELVQALIEDYASDLSVEDTHQYTPPHLAALNGHKELVDLLIKKYNYSIGASGTHFYTLLHMACLGGHIDLTTTLLNDHRADVEARDIHNNTAVIFAVWRGHNKIVDLLIKEFKCNRYIRGFKNRTLLHQACLCGHFQLVRKLVSQYTLNVNSRDIDQNAPICLAAQRGHGKIAIHLIEVYCISPVVTFKDDTTLLHYACEGGNLDLVRTLIMDYDMDMYKENKHGQSPLSIAMKNHHSKMVQALFEQKMISSIKCPRGDKTILHYASEVGDLGLVRTLALVTGNDLDLDSKDRYGNTPLSMAMKHHHRNMVHSLLLEFPIIPTVTDSQGRTLLHLACKYGYFEIIDVLLKIDKSIMHTRDNKGKLPADLLPEQLLVSIHTSTSDVIIFGTSVCTIDDSSWYTSSDIIIFRSCLSKCQS